MTADGRLIIAPTEFTDEVAMREFDRNSFRYLCHFEERSDEKSSPHPKNDAEQILRVLL